MTEKYSYQFVDSNLMAGWSDDGTHVSWMNPFTGEETPGAEIENLFRTLIEKPDEITEDFISTLNRIFFYYLRDMRNGDFDFFFKEETSGRASLLYQFRRADDYIRSSASERKRLYDLLENDDEDGSGRPEISEENALKIKSHYISLMPTRIFEQSLLLLRLDPVLLHAPEGNSFILGPCPMNIINPYFSGRHPEGSEGYEEELCGACLIMPVTPTTAFCLYDPDIYRFRKKGGKCMLTPHDVDVLNMIQIYNGGKDYGFVYKGDGDNLRSAIGRLGNHDDWKNYEESDSYPFATDLSLCLVKAGAEENFSSYYDDPYAKFVQEMQKYDQDSFARKLTPEYDYGKERHRRFVFAHNYLFEHEIEE